MRTIVVIGYPDFGNHSPEVIYVGNDGEAAMKAVADSEAGKFKRAIKLVNPIGVPIPLDGTMAHRIHTEAQERAVESERQATAEKRRREVTQAEKRFADAEERFNAARGAKAPEPETPADEFEEQLAKELKGVSSTERIVAEAKARAERHERVEAARKAKSQAEREYKEAHKELHALNAERGTGNAESKNGAGETPAPATETVALSETGKPKSSKKPKQ